MLRKLILTNFQKHAHLEVDFSSGTTIVTGANWAGKSTLLRGILFALFGPAAVPGGAKIIQKRGVKAKPKAVLTFSLADKEYEVTRSPSTTRLTERTSGDTYSTIAVGAGPVTEKVEQLLGFQGKLFADLRTAPQEEAGSILTLGSAKLGQILNTITQVDVVDRVIVSAAARAAGLKARVEVEKEIDIEKEKKTLMEQAVNLNTSYAALTQAMEVSATAGSTLEAAEKAYNELRERAAAAQNNQKARDRLQGELDALMSQSNKIHQELNLLEARVGAPIEELSGAYNTALEQLKKEQEAQRKHVELLRSTEANMQGLVKRQDIFRNREKEQIAALKSLGKVEDMADLEARVLDKHDEDVRLRALWKQLDDAATNSFCAVCLRPFDESHDPQELMDKAAAAKADLLSNEKVLRNLQESLVAGKKENLAIETAAADLERLMEQMLEHSRVLDQERAKVRELERSMPTMTPNLETKVNEALVAHQTETKLLGDLLAKKTQLEEIQKEMQRCSSTLVKISGPEPVPQEDLTACYEAYVSKQEPASAAKASAASLSTKYRLEYASYQEVKQTYKDYKATASRQAKDRKTLVLLKLLKGYLTKNRDAFTERVWGSLLSYASQFISQATTGAVTAVSRDSSGGFKYTEDEQEMPIQAASGLQRAIIGTAVRLALAEAVRSSARFFLLDEPTAAASDENSMAMVQALSQTGLQIVLVTHRPADAAIADSTIQL